MKIHQRIKKFVICQKFIQQILEKLIWYCYKNRTKCCKIASKNVVHKTAEATGELIGNKITEEIVKTKPATDEN